MKSLRGLVASKSIETHDCNSYEIVATEYYDESLHPTCGDFRLASRQYLQRLFEIESPSGRMADVGCGRSLLAEFVRSNLVLVDESRQMLRLSRGYEEARVVNVEAEPFGSEEFDWVFAVLADPYNSVESWRHIREAMVSGGHCVFIVPSTVWARRFRRAASDERPGFARFELSNGQSVYLRSLILSENDQKDMIRRAGLAPVDVHHVLAGDLATLRSTKLSAYLFASDPILDVYRVTRPS